MTDLGLNEFNIIRLAFFIKLTDFYDTHSALCHIVISYKNNSRKCMNMQFSILCGMRHSLSCTTKNAVYDSTKPSSLCNMPLFAS